MGIKILFAGDIVGRPGREACAHYIPRLRQAEALDFVIANGENAAGGFGGTPEILETLLGFEIDVITMGNHVFAKKEIETYLPGTDRVLRPANFPEAVPGQGACVQVAANGQMVGVINVQGTVFMESLASPFETARRLVTELRAQTPVVIVDIHAEATAEKQALGFYLDGLCTAVIGTHTHVQTTDERILPGGTAYITDVGMVGPENSVIGMEKDTVLERFLLKMPRKFRVAKASPAFSAALIECDDATGRALAIRRMHLEMKSDP